MDIFLTVVFMAAWFASGSLAQKWREIRAHRVALAALMFAATMVLGMAWSSQPLSASKEGMVEALRFAMIAPLTITFRDERIRSQAISAFLAASTLILIVSLLLSSGAVSSIPGVRGTPDYPIIFKSHITHNLLMAIAAALFLLRAFDAAGHCRWMYALLTVAASYNVVFMIPGRTGQLALATALIYVACARFRLRGLVIGGAGLVAVAAIAWWDPGSIMHKRAALAVQEASAWHPGEAQPLDSSVGLRLEYYRNSLELISEHPLLGAGTGAFHLAYRDHVADKGMVATDNPHNGFLLVGVELGLLGLVALAWLLCAQWRTAHELGSRTECMAARGFLVAFIAASLVSSTFSDHVEGFFFAWASALFWSGLRPLNSA